ncbi:unnamed protein product [Ectocarpus fasciculatus]
MISSRPELEEARLAAALIGIDATFGLGRASSGLWCYDTRCVGSACSVDDLLEGDTVASLGIAPSCSWKDERTVTIVFGTGYSIGEGSTITLNPTGEYIAGCSGCTDYATGKREEIWSVVVQARTPPPELSSAWFSNTGQQVFIQFEGSASSQEINGSYAVVPCEEAFSDSSAATLGVGCASQFTSSSILTVELGFDYTIRPSSDLNCTDGDGTSISLLEGIARTEIGAFLTAAAGCVVVGPASEPNPPVVDISAPEIVGCCDDLILEGIATYPSTGFTCNWTVGIVDGNQSFDLADARTVLDQAGFSSSSSIAGAENGLVVALPSASLDEGSTYWFGLRVTMGLGLWSEASVEVFKSTDALPALKIAGSASWKQWRGLPLTVRTEVTSPRSQDDNVTYTWTLASEYSTTEDFPPVTLIKGRNPSVLKLPAYSLGHAGSIYVFRVTVAGSTPSTTSATATVEVISGAIIAHIYGGTKRRVGVLQDLYLNASVSVDDDQLDESPLQFRWNCTDDVGEDCTSPSTELLDIESFSTGGLLTISSGALPIGVKYTFGVTVFQDSAELRSDDTACTVSTFEGTLPHVTVSPKAILRKYDPSKKVVLQGCASPSAEEPCSSSTSSRFMLEWRPESGNLDLTNGWDDVFSTATSDRVLVVRNGVLGAGRTYTFSLSATDTSGQEGYAEFSFETNAPPAGGHVESNTSSATAGVDGIRLQSIGWTDDVDDLPFTHSFGFVHGYHEVATIASESVLLNRLSSSWSASPTLRTKIPSGLADDGYNVTIVVSVSDSLGSTASTNLGADGTPMIIASTPPEQASVLSLAYGLSCFPTDPCGNESLAYPEDTLRDARVATALLLHAPQTNTSDVEAIMALQETLAGLIVEAYLSLETSSSSVMAGSQALAGALVSFTKYGALSELTLAEVTEAVKDMAETTIDLGETLDDASALSLVSILSVLFVGQTPFATSSASAAVISDTALLGKEDSLTVLAEVGLAMATDAEAGEELDERSVGDFSMQPARAHPIDMSSTTVSVGESGAKVSFGDWDSALDSDEDLGSTRTFAVATFNSTTSGLDGVTVIDAWDSTGSPEYQLPRPVGVSMALPEPLSTGLEVEGESSLSHVGCAYWSEVSGDWKTDGMVLAALGVALDDTHAVVVECATFHLSAFAGREDSTTPTWSTADLTDFSLLAEYGAESWEALLFLGCVAAVLLGPAAWFAVKDAGKGQRREHVEALWDTYLARGKSRREARPLKKRVAERAKSSRETLVDTRSRASDYVGYHQISVRRKEKAMGKVVVESLLFNHSWRHLSGSPTAHFKRTLLTRSQHLVLLLTDWMSAIVLQAVFYGKSQFGVEMTVVSALFMLPAGLIFPALLRVANTPPASQTLERPLSQEERPEHAVEYRTDRRQVEQEKTDDDFQATFQKRGSKHRVGFQEQDRPPRKASPTRMFATKEAQGTASPFLMPKSNTAVVKTTAYRDVVEMQKALLLVYVPLPILLAMLVSEVLRVSREAEVAGGDDYAFLHNMVTSLSLASSALSIVSAFSVVSRSARTMRKATAFQGVVAPGMALCGVLLFGSGVFIAAAAVLGAVITLVGSYLVGVQRKYEEILGDLVEGDLVAAWSNPTREMHKAAETIQCCFRVHHAVDRATRALEFRTWLLDCRGRRRGMYFLAQGAVATTTLCLIYTNMVFAAKFDRSTSTDWLTTCVLALLVEALIQQPAALLSTLVLGDFVEEGANLLLDLIL